MFSLCYNIVTICLFFLRFWRVTMVLVKILGTIKQQLKIIINMPDIPLANLMFFLHVSLANFLILQFSFKKSEDFDKY